MRITWMGVDPYQWIRGLPASSSTTTAAATIAGGGGGVPPDDDDDDGGDDSDEHSDNNNNGDDDGHSSRSNATAPHDEDEDDDNNNNNNDEAAAVVGEDETYDHINPNPADDSDNYYPMVKRRFENFVFQIDNPVGYAFLGYNEHDKHIQILKRVELANHFESVFYVDPDHIPATNNNGNTRKGLIKGGKPERRPFITAWLKDSKKKKKLEIVYYPGCPSRLCGCWLFT